MNAIDARETMIEKEKIVSRIGLNSVLEYYSREDFTCARVSDLYCTKVLIAKPEDNRKRYRYPILRLTFNHFKIPKDIFFKERYAKDQLLYGLYDTPNKTTVRQNSHMKGTDLYQVQIYIALLDGKRIKSRLIEKTKLIDYLFNELSKFGRQLWSLNETIIDRVEIWDNPRHRDVIFNIQLDDLRPMEILDLLDFEIYSRIGQWYIDNTKIIYMKEGKELVFMTRENWRIYDQIKIKIDMGKGRRVLINFNRKKAKIKITKI